MKQNNRYRTLLTTALFLAAAIATGSIALTACERENETIVNPTKKGASDIPCFKDIDELEKTLETAYSFDTLPKLIEFEDSQRRRSIGAIADAFYETIDWESIKGEKEAISFYEKHEDMLDTIMVEGEVAILPKLIKSPYRYAANKDQLFIVGEYCCKIFKQGVVSTKMEHLKELMSLDEQELDNIDTTIFLYPKGKSKSSVHPGCWPIWHNEYQTYRGRKAVLITVDIDCVGDNVVTKSVIINMKSVFFFNHLKLDKRTTTFKGDVTIHSSCDGLHFSAHTYSWPLWIVRMGSCCTTFHRESIQPYLRSCGYISPTNYHFKSFHIFVDQPELGIRNINWYFN